MRDWERPGPSAMPRAATNASSTDQPKGDLCHLHDHSSVWSLQSRPVGAGFRR